MIPVLFDTNIYGKIVVDPEKEDVVTAILASKFTVLNFKLIRDELRHTAKGKTFGGGKKLRPFLVTTYDRIASPTQVSASKELEQLADAYYVQYRKLGGGVGKKKIINDLRILACASLKNCNLVVSEDSHMLASSKATAARSIVNAQQGIRQPGITSYRGLKNLINVT